MLDIVKCAIKNIVRKKGRTFLTVIGISIGVASVIIISNISNCGSKAVNNELSSLGLGALYVSCDSVSHCLSEDELNIIKNTMQVKSASPVIMRNTEVFGRKGKEDAILWGIDSNANQIISLQTIYGRNLSNSDVRSGNNVCMVDQKFSRALYNRDNIVGKHISLVTMGKAKEYEVVGVIKPGSGLLQNVIGNYIPNFIYIPYTSMQNITGSNAFDQIAIKVEQGKNIDIISKDILKSLNSKIIGTTESEIYKVNSLVKQKESLNKLMNIVTIIFSMVGAISLFVASMSIMTVMLMGVNERTREIGIKKSIGASKGAILKEFLMEALLLTLFGCILGLILGLLISYLGAQIFSIDLHIRLDMVLWTVFLSIICGTIFGIYPAIKAANLRPVDALRWES